MNNTVNIVLKIDPATKKTFYNLCKGLGITPMRTILILIEKFAEGSIDAMPILSEYKEFKSDERDRKVRRILKYRISGDEAYKMNKATKKEEEQSLNS